MSLYEWTHDHETSADYGKVRLDDSKGDRDDDCAGHVDVVEEAGNKIDSHRTDDARSVIQKLEPCLICAGASRGRYGKVLQRTGSEHTTRQEPHARTDFPLQ